MDDFPRSCCLYHPGQIITNFCTDKACLMPLCPTCICTHSSTHPNGRSSLAHINQITTLCLKQIQEMILSMQSNRLAAELVNRKINDDRQSWSQIIDRTKFQVMEMVDGYFEEFKRQVELGRQKQNKLLGLHVPERMRLIEKRIGEYSGQLMEMKSDLFNERCLSTLITFYHENKSAFEKVQVELQQEIKSNDMYSPVLVLQPDAFHKLKSSLLQFFTLNLGAIKNEKSLVRAPQSPRHSINAMPSLMHSPIHSPIQTPFQTPHHSNQTSRVMIEAPPFNNISNFNTTYPYPSHQPALSLSLEQNNFKPSKSTTNNSFYPAEEKSPRSSLGIKLMAQKGNSVKRTKSPITLRRNNPN